MLGVITFAQLVSRATPFRLTERTGMPGHAAPDPAAIFGAPSDRFARLPPPAVYGVSIRAATVMPVGTRWSNQFACGPLRPVSLLRMSWPVRDFPDRMGMGRAWEIGVDGRAGVRTGAVI